MKIRWSGQSRPMSPDELATLPACLGGLGGGLSGIGSFATMHPHTHCILCQQLAPAQTDRGDVTMEVLTAFLLKNYTEAKQDLASKLLREFAIGRR